jgi:uncharacterized protein YuzE
MSSDTQDFTSKTRNTNLLIVGIVAGFVVLSVSTYFLFFRGVSLNNDDSSEEGGGDVQEESVLSEPEDTTTYENSEGDEDTRAEQNKDVFERLGYEVVYVSDNIRYDDAPIYYLLIDQVDLQKFDPVRQKIEEDIYTIVEEEGKEISLEIFDDEDALELYYKSHYGVGELGRILTDEEQKFLERHSIASYAGALETGLYFNTLYFFPGYLGKNAQIRTLKDIIEITL